MMRSLGRALLVATLVAGLTSAVRQRLEAQQVRRGTLTAASASADVPPRVAYGPLAARLSEWVPERPTTPLGRLAASAWAGPLTVVGLLIALLAGRRPTWDDELGCFVAIGMRGPSSLALRALGADANTVGQIMLVTPTSPSRVLLAHEAVHARQAERFGPLLLPLYLWLGARYGYRDHPLERSARSGARHFRDTH